MKILVYALKVLIFLKENKVQKGMNFFFHTEKSLENQNFTIIGTLFDYFCRGEDTFLISD